MKIKEMTDEQLGEEFNIYVARVNSGNASDEDLATLDTLYAEIIDRKLARSPVWM